MFDEDTISYMEFDLDESIASLVCMNGTVIVPNHIWHINGLKILTWLEEMYGQDLSIKFNGKGSPVSILTPNDKILTDDDISQFVVWARLRYG